MATAGTYNFTMDQGSDLIKKFTWKDSDLVVIDLTGWTARMQIRKSISSVDALLELTTENGGIALGGVLGTITVTITDVQSAALTPATLRYDLELIAPITGLITRLIMGTVTNRPEVTR